MNKEPIALYIFRFVLGFGLFAFMAMLYWSSLLLEQNIQSQRLDLQQIKSELSTIKEKLYKLSVQPLSISQIKTPSTPSSEPIAMNEENLLTPDLFYLQTLPNLLGPDFKPQGVFRRATIGKPHHLSPFSEFSEISTYNKLCSVSLFTEEFGKYETYSPFMADRMELRYNEQGNPEYWFTLRQDVYWQPLNPRHLADGVELAPEFLKKHKVTAHDFKFYYDVVMNPHIEEARAVTLRAYFDEIEEVKVVDDFTLVIQCRTKEFKNADGKKVQKLKYASKSIFGLLAPLPRFVYQYFADGTKIIADDQAENTYRVNPVWAQNFAHHWALQMIVSCGAWTFDGLTEREIRFKRNPDFYDPLVALTEALEYKFTDSIETMWNDFKIGNLDLVVVLPNQLSELKEFLKSAPYQKQKSEGNGISSLNYLARVYSYVAWNEVRPLFKSKKVRQALTMAINRERIIRQIFHGMAIQTTGTFFPYSPSYDKSIQPYPFDVERARQLLEEEGWSDSRGTGIIEKMIDGKLVPFRFELTYFVKNPQTKSMCEFIATSLKEVGIDCLLKGVDLADLSAAIDNKDLDALCMAWALGTPPEDPKQLWYSTNQEKGSSNFISFSNKEIDRLIEALEYEADPEKRVELYHQFDRILYDEAPYVFLNVPKTTIAYRDYLQNVFIPADRQDLIPGANVGEPQSSIFWIKKTD